MDCRRARVNPFGTEVVPSRIVFVSETYGRIEFACFMIHPRLLFSPMVEIMIAVDGSGYEQIRSHRTFSDSLLLGMGLWLMFILT